MNFLSNLSLGKKVFLLLAAGLIISIGVFSFLATRAVHQSTEAMLEDRLTTTRLVAGYLDETLRRARAELDATAPFLGIGLPGEDNRQAVADLEVAY